MLDKRHSLARGSFGNIERRSIGEAHGGTLAGPGAGARAAAQVNRLPEVRQEKVAALGRAISQGKYEVSAEQTAAAMVSEMHVHSSPATQMSGWQGVNQNVGEFIDQRDVLIGHLCPA